MRTTTSSLTDNSRALLRLEVVREFLSAREGVRRREHIHRLHAAELAARHVVARPEFRGLSTLAIPQVVQVRALIEQVRADVRHHLGTSTAVLPKIDDERVGAGQK